MTWRERIVAARARKEARRWWKPWTWSTPLRLGWPFTDEDSLAAVNISTCAGGEMTRAYGLEFDRHLFDIGTLLLGAIHAGSPEAAERLLDAMEDRALQVKRAVHAGADG